MSEVEILCFELLADDCSVLISLRVENSLGSHLDGLLIRAVVSTLTYKGTARSYLLRRFEHLSLGEAPDNRQLVYTLTDKVALLDWLSEWCVVATSYVLLLFDKRIQMVGIKE